MTGIIIENKYSSLTIEADNWVLDASLIVALVIISQQEIMMGWWPSESDKTDECYRNPGPMTKTKTRIQE